MSVTDTLICSNCHQPNQRSAKHCRYCGKPLAGSSSSSVPDTQSDSDVTTGSLKQRQVPPPPKPIALTASASAPTPMRSLSAAEKEVQQPPSLSAHSVSAPPQPVSVLDSSAAPTKESIRQKLQKLKELLPHIARFFPADLANKDAKLDEWRMQIGRASWCLTLFDHPLLQETLLQDSLFQEPLFALSNAVKALDFTMNTL